MAKLEEITVGSSVLGIAGNEPVSIVAVQWYGTNVIEITYKNSKGVPGTQLLYRDDEGSIIVQDNSLPWSFDADGGQMRLIELALRICLIHIWLSTRHQWSHCHIRYRQFIRKCYQDCL